MSSSIPSQKELRAHTLPSMKDKQVVRDPSAGTELPAARAASPKSQRCAMARLMVLETAAGPSYTRKRGSLKHAFEVWARSRESFGLQQAEGEMGRTFAIDPSAGRSPSHSLQPTRASPHRGASSSFRRCQGTPAAAPTQRGRTAPAPSTSEATSPGNGIAQQIDSKAQLFSIFI